jgi:hypothetical protein
MTLNKADSDRWLIDPYRRHQLHVYQIKAIGHPFGHATA